MTDGEENQNCTSDDESWERERAYALYYDFHGCENDNFQVKKSDIFRIFTQNVDRGYGPTIYVLEPK